MTMPQPGTMPADYLPGITITTYDAIKTLGGVPNNS
jgi:hypothetical protein